jgi:hypothetical protein
MFRVQRSTSSLRDEQPPQIDIAHHGEFVKVRSKAPLRSVALVDLLGRVTLLDIDHGAMEVIRPLPEHGALWQCVVVTDVRGNVVGRPIVRR